jgi:molybdopterin-containing oxidoreductase family membrane subunit
MMKKNLKLMSKFFNDLLVYSLTGNKAYHLWMGTLSFIMILGAILYSVQLENGLAVTGMNDHVSWGLYISNFTFLVGLAAAAVMLVIPAYVFSDVDLYKVVLIGEGVAVGALLMCLAFVTVDIGGPQRFWHLIPGIGRLNFPQSLLAWDIIVLNGYLALNLLIPFYILFNKYQGKHANKKIYIPLVFLSIFWAVALHMVTAFLYSGLSSRPFWNNALLGPRFLASAFAGGPAFILVMLGITKKFSDFKVNEEILKKIALIVTIAAQVNLLMLGSEIFKEFYNATHHSISAVYLFFGIGSKNALVPWIWTSISINIIATVTLTIHKLRSNPMYRYPACILLFIAIWIEKGMGLVVPGFIPSPLGTIVEYQPTLIEIGITIGIWAFGLFVITTLVRLGFAVEQNHIRYDSKNRGDGHV